MPRGTALLVINVAALAAVGAACPSELDQCLTLEDEIRALAADRSAGCATDADCVLVQADTNCGTTCGAVVRVGQEAAFAAALEDLDEREGAHCNTRLFSSCLPSVPRCFSGTCGPSFDPDAGPWAIFARTPGRPRS